MSAPLTVWHTRANKLGNAEQLQHYWTKTPEGLAQWATSPKPWTTLVALLAKYVDGPEGLAATYYHAVFHHWPNQSAKPKRKGKRK